MPDPSIFVIMLAAVVAWLVLKLIFKLTMKIFSCGCLLILAVGGLIFFSSYFGLS